MKSGNQPTKISTLTVLPNLRRFQPRPWSGSQTHAFSCYVPGPCFLPPTAGFPRSAAPAADKYFIFPLECTQLDQRFRSATPAGRASRLFWMTGPCWAEITWTI